MMPMPRSDCLCELLVGLLLGAVILGGLVAALLLLIPARPHAPVPSVEMPWPSKPVLEEHRP